MAWNARMLAVVVLLAAAGCGHRSVSINSEPSGALVFINGNEVGRTPMKYDFDLYGDFDVILRKEGFETLKTSRNIKTPIHGYPPLDLFADMFGVRDTYEWRFDLTPAATLTVDAQELINRGQSLKQDLQSSKYTRTPTTLPVSPPVAPTTQE